MKNWKRDWVCVPLLVGTAALCGSGCARPPQITEQVSSINPLPPPDLRLGKTPIGGPSESRTGAGAGGSAAAGYEAGRVSGSMELPTTPMSPYGVTYSRMSPVASDGSSTADRGFPLAPDQPLVPSNAKGVTQQFTPTPGQVPVNVDAHSITGAPMKR